MYLFFNKLSQLMTDGTVINLAVHCQNGKFTVSLFPKLNGLKDEAQNHLHPVILTGTPEELDEGFFDAVRQPVQKTTGLLTGMKAFEESIARMEAEKKETHEQKRNVDRHAKARKEKYENLIVRADTQEKEGNNDNALFLLREAHKIADGEEIAKTDAKIEQLKTKTSQNSLF
jgi:PRTRC genetic system protein E